MRSPVEILFRRTAGIGALLTLGALGAAAAGAMPGWTTLILIYLTGVSYGFSEMVRLFERHRRRCAECLEGAGPHIRWWTLRIVLVLLVSLLPALLLLPLATSLQH